MSTRRTASAVTVDQVVAELELFVLECIRAREAVVLRDNQADYSMGYLSAMQDVLHRLVCLKASREENLLTHSPASTLPGKLKGSHDASTHDRRQKISMR